MSKKRSDRKRRGPGRKGPPEDLKKSASRDARSEKFSLGISLETTPTIVAVGASAGGLDAFSHILENLPPAPNVAIVFVQHLSPQHESALPALLSARTSLPVTQVTDGMRIEANHVYVVPPNVQMEINDGHLTLLPRPHDRSQFTPIDFFFESLARSARERAIGVILSGTASDGSIGVREIKAVGGITIAQNEETAKYDGMPRAAIATGMIDQVLTPKEIADQISHLSQHHLGARSDGGKDPAATEEDFQELFTLLRRTSGIDFKQYKIPTVKRRLRRRMALLKITDLGTYLRYIREHPPEATALCQDLLIHVTRFFRDPDSFKALAVHALQEIVLKRSNDPIRIWIPGCATGEEAYSVAIVLMELLGERATDRKVQIFATDVSELAIEQARKGTYASSIAADISAERLSRFFTKSDGAYRVSKILRDMCVFARHDLASDPPFSRLDLIACRNVLIYLDAALQRRVISLFHHALKVRGFLMLGGAETTGPLADFTLVDKKWRLYRKAPGEDVITFALPHEQPPDIRMPGEGTATTARPEGRLQDEADRVVLDKYGPPGVVVDTKFEIAHFRGHTGPYLEQPSGEPSLNVLKMARNGLLHPLRSALNLALRKRRPARKENVLVQRGSEWKSVNVEVVPLTTSRGEYFLVLFETSAAGRERKGWKAAKAGRGDKTDARLSDIRRELAASREYLQSIIQELEAANEELQGTHEEVLSTNEELQSTNEELDTAREELESANEELNTLNEELDCRNTELGRLNADLINVLSSVDMPIVIVGDDMRIRRFTPAAERLFNLIPGDVGRPIGQINSNLVSDNLEGLIRTTIDGVAPREQEVIDRAGRWYSLRIRPYKGVDNRLDGAVLMAIDVNAARQLQTRTEKSLDYFTRIVEMVDQPLLVVDGNLRVRSANGSFRRTFEDAGQKIEGTLFDALSNGLWNAPELRDVLSEALKNDATYHAVSSQEGGRPRIEFKVRGFELEDASRWILVAVETPDA